MIAPVFRVVLVSSALLGLSGCTTYPKKNAVDVSPDMSQREPVSFLVDGNKQPPAPALSPGQEQIGALAPQSGVVPTAKRPSSPSLAPLPSALPKPALRHKPRPKTDKFESHLVQDFINNVSRNEFARVRNTLAATPDMVNATTRWGDMPFPSINTVEMAELLLGKGADINSTTSKKETALILQFFGINPKSMAVVRFLLAQGADVTVQDKYGESVLFRLGDSPEMVAEMVARGADVNVQNNQGETPLHHVIRTRRIRCVEALLKAGAQSGKKNHKGAAPLHYATAGDPSPEMVELLLRHGADVNAEMQDGRRPIDNAIQQGSDKVVQLLKARGAKPY